MIGHLERRFTERGGSVDGEVEEYKDDWDGYVHPQGWPRKWIIPGFHVKITGLFGEVLDEILCKTKVDPRTVEAIWRILQPSDPLYVAGSPSARPSDVPSLIVTDEDQWVGELEAGEQRTVLPDFQGEWVTVFEYRELAQAGGYDVDHRSKTCVSAALFRPEHLDSNDVTESGFEHTSAARHPYESLTWDQFQQAIMAVTHIQPDEESAMWPIASIARSPCAFVGFPSLASLCPYIIGDYSLEFRDFLTVHGRDTVARYETWREGWFSSDYSDEPMALGCRLQVRAEFLRSLCARYRRAFVVRTEETRECYESYKRKPVRSQKKALMQSANAIETFVLDLLEWSLGRTVEHAHQRPRVVLFQIVPNNRDLSVWVTIEKAGKNVVSQQRFEPLRFRVIDGLVQPVHAKPGRALPRPIKTWRLKLTKEAFRTA